MPSWTYTASAQTQDALLGDYSVQVAQISAKFGAGRFAALEIAG